LESWEDSIMSDRPITELRREPPPFRRVTVTAVADLSPHLRRITFSGDELERLVIEEPAASVRLLVPTRGTNELIMPEWNGNEFLLPDGRRPLIRTFTPRHLRTGPAELDLDVVLHGNDGASGWATGVEVGDPAAISGPGRGYEIDPAADPLLLLGDETAIPAIAQLLEVVSTDIRIVAHIEVARSDARVGLPEHPNATVTWHDLPAGAPPGAELASAIESEDIGPGTRVWAAGEAAGVQRIRKHLRTRDIDRTHATVRGYWKVGRAGPG
jgi:NADPH-dependent ferric siderophore reductase